MQDVAAAAESLRNARSPTIFVGWGAVDATREVALLAERLGAPVATTLQGVSAFPANHPLHAGFCLGRAAVPAVEKAFAGIDCMLAVGTRFGEIATGSYGWTPPASLIHVDINPAVFSANYPAAVALEGDAKAVLKLLLQALGETPIAAAPGAPRAGRGARSASRRRRISRNGCAHDTQGRVNPARFFASLRRQLA